jgi:excisionase family DNA binding protein
MNPHSSRSRKTASAEKQLHDSLLADVGDRMISIRKAAALSGVDFRTIEKAIAKGELRVITLGKKSRRLRLSEVTAWWDRHAPEKIAPI